MDKCIEILAQDAMETVLDQRAEGRMALTYECLVAWPDGKVRRSFLKVFHRSRQLGVLNEIMGYVLGRAAKLPVAPRAGLIAVNPDELSDVDPNQYCLEMAFVVESIPGDCPMTEFDKGASDEGYALLEVVKKWQGLPETIAFDDWVGNPDRNAGNIIVVSKSKVFLIDHSNMPVDIRWNREMLNPDKEVENRLAKILQWDEDGAPLPVRNRISHCAKVHSEYYTAALKELQFWWSNLLHDPKDVKALERFFSVRADQGLQRLSQKYQVMAI